MSHSLYTGVVQIHHCICSSCVHYNCGNIKMWVMEILTVDFLCIYPLLLELSGSIIV